MKVQKKLNLIKITVRQLLDTGVHVGCSPKLLSRSLKPYYLGKKGDFKIFNLKHLRLQFKLLLNTVVGVVSRRQAVLVVSHQHNQGDLRPLLDLYQLFLLQGAWTGGTLTNRKQTKNRLWHLRVLKTLPAIVIFLNPTVENWGLKECLNLNIPASMVTGNVFDKFNSVLYPVTADDRSQSSLIFYSHLIGNAVKRGLLREQLGIFNLKKNG